MIWFYYFLIIILLICPNARIVATSSRDSAINKCIHNERRALLDFKAALEDPDGKLSTWRLEDDDCCKWSGVVCNNQTHHVTQLHLSPYGFVVGGRLGGEISSSLVNLSYLNHLDLSYNKFSGTIPDFIGSMTQLRYLDLAFNALVGTIPSFIGSMTQLRHFDLHGNFFNGVIPRSIGSLTQLRYLDLSSNFFVGNTLPEFGNLTNLRNLSLGPIKGCTIENLDWLSKLSHLQHLQMDRISLAKANYWIDAILSLPKLSVLNLEGCDLSEVMYPNSSIGNSSSPSIQYLSLRYNNLNSSMYHWLFPLTSNKLVSFDLSGNTLDGIPKYLGELCSLKSLYFSTNSATVNFTEFLNNLCGCTSISLEELDVTDNQFIGSLSDDIQKFSSLQSLKLSYSQLNGTMSGKVWELPNLQTLDVSSNSLRGECIVENTGKSKLVYIDLSNNPLELIPSKVHILNLSNVEHLDLNSCKLGPLFPRWIQTLKKLNYLDIANTGISDTIPIEFWNTWPSRLTFLDLSSNNISGKVPDLSSNFNLYPVIDLSSNNFYGTIQNVPSTLVSLNLSRNKFYGGVSFLCQIVDGFLSFIDLSHNYLTGQLPECLWHFKELQVLNLGHNKFFGRLDAAIGYLFQLEVLDLYNNNFSGELPLALKNCNRLSFLNLGANKFFGNVPTWIGENLTELYAFSLRSNNFFGPIPLQLCRLMNLQILDLSMNSLNGTIPSCVNNLNAMVVGTWSLEKRNNHDYLSITRNGPKTYLGTYVDNAVIEWQGNEHEFTGNLGLLMSIDLSSNNLTGKIPNELTNLHELVALNLSKNALLGEIPQKVGEMKRLLTLDLSRNTFSGRIPSSMSQMTSLNFLDLSHNNFRGRIPSSTQLQSFEPSKFTGNAGLCGPPLTKSCFGDEVPGVSSKSENSEEGTDEMIWFYIGGFTGFATGFWIACGTLLLNHRMRHAFFPFVDFLKDWVYRKAVVVFIQKVKRVQHK